MKIPTHTAGKLASEQTPVASADRSGQIVGAAVGELAQKVFNIAEDVQEKQQELRRKAELSKSISAYDAEMVVKGDEIRRANMESPEKAIEDLRAFQAEASARHKAAIADQETRLRFDAVAFDTNVKEQAKTELWSAQATGVLVQRTYIETLNANAIALSGSDDVNFFFDKSHFPGEQDAKKQEFRSGVYQAFGGPKAGAGVLQKANQSNFNAFFSGLLSRGEGFLALEYLKDPRISELGLNPAAVPKMEAAARKVVDANKSNEAALTLASYVEENGRFFDTVMKGEVSLAELAEKSNVLSYNIMQTQKEVAAGRALPETVATMRQQQRVLELLQEARLTRDEKFIVPNADTTAEMETRFNTLLGVDKGENKSVKGKLDELFQFQQELLEKRNQLDPKDFDKWSRFAEVAFQNEVQGITRSKGLGLKKTWFGLGGDALKKSDKLSANEKLRRKMSDVVTKTAKTDGQAFAYETLRFFMDDLEERIDLKDPAAVANLNDALLDELTRGAQGKARLKSFGYPTHLKVKDPLKVGNYSFPISGFDDDGMPVLEMGE